MKNWEDQSTTESCLEILTEMRDSANIWSLCILNSFSMTIQPMVNMLQNRQTGYKDGILAASNLVDKFSKFNSNSLIWTTAKTNAQKILSGLGIKNRLTAEMTQLGAMNSIEGIFLTLMQKAING